MEMSNDEDRAAHIGTSRRKCANKFSHRLLLRNEKVRVHTVALVHPLAAANYAKFSCVCVCIMEDCLCAPQDIVSLGAGEEGSCPAPLK